MFCASVAYPITENGTFDFEYFATKHVPMFVRYLGDNCLKFEIHKNLEQPGAPKPLYICSAHFWVKSGEEFGKTLARHGKEIYGDIHNFTDIEPVREWAEVLT